MLPIKVFENRLEAETAKSLLESHGIGAMVSADDCGGMRPELSFASGVRLLVLEEHVASALAILTPPANGREEPLRPTSQ